MKQRKPRDHMRLKLAQAAGTGSKTGLTIDTEHGGAFEGRATARWVSGVLARGMTPTTRARGQTSHACSRPPSAPWGRACAARQCYALAPAHYLLTLTLPYPLARHLLASRQRLLAPSLSHSRTALALAPSRPPPPFTPPPPKNRLPPAASHAPPPTPSHPPRPHPATRHARTPSFNPSSPPSHDDYLDLPSPPSRYRNTAGTMAHSGGLGLDSPGPQRPIIDPMRTSTKMPTTPGAEGGAEGGAAQTEEAGQGVGIGGGGECVGGYLGAEGRGGHDTGGDTGGALGLLQLPGPTKPRQLKPTPHAQAVKTWGRCTTSAVPRPHLWPRPLSARSRPWRALRKQ